MSAATVRAGHHAGTCQLLANGTGYDIAIIMNDQQMVTLPEPLVGQDIST
jgi:hypothetical protein